MKYELGIMTNKWECEADNADVAVVTIMLMTQTSAPVAIYSPSDVESDYCMLGVSQDKGKTEQLESFLEKNKDKIKECYKTIKELT